MGILFISHSSKNNSTARRVRNWLRDQGWNDVFLDLDPTEGLAPGQRWQDELKRAGENCAAVIALISPDWAASRWCQAEFLLAEQLGKRIFPVFVVPTPLDDLPSELKAKFQLADISSPEREAEGFERLAIGLKRAGLDPRSFPWPPANDRQRAVYRGLGALEEVDAAIFFGRDTVITKGLDELRRLRAAAPQRLFVVLGASGAGKSSFLRAGLISRLARDEENFLVLPIIRPESAAITGTLGLAASLTKATGQTVALTNGPQLLVEAFSKLRAPIVDRLSRTASVGGEAYSAKPPTVVIPVDQAEELFNIENLEGQAFCRLIAAALALDQNALVIVAIRSDTYEALQTDPALAGVGQVLFSLGPVVAGSFKEIIEGPARLSTPALEVEPNLTEQLLVDLHTADALPLLAFTLERLQILYGRSGRLSLADYVDKLGGLSGAIQSAVATALGPNVDEREIALVHQVLRASACACRPARREASRRTAQRHSAGSRSTP